MQNAYFQTALKRASAILGNKGRLLNLVSQLLLKSNSVNLSKGYWKLRLQAIGRLLKAFALGRYRNIQLKSILLLTAAVIYFINPFDLVPDAIVGLGLVDDFTILTWVYNLVSFEMEKFMQWEESISKS